MAVSPLKSLWTLTAGYRRRYAAAIAAMATGTIFLLLVPYVMKWALDELTAETATITGTLVPAGLLIVAFHVVHGGFTYLRGRWAAQASEGITRDLRHRLYAHLEQLPCSYLDRIETGDVVQRCSSDVETVRVFLAAQVVEIGRVSLFLLVAIPLMLAEDVRMTVVSLSVVPFIITFAVMFFAKVRKLFELVDEAEGRLTTVLQENLTGVRVVRAFGQQDYEIEKFQRQNDEFRDLEYRLFFTLSNYWGVSDILCLSQLGVILVGGGYFVLQGSITTGSWIMFFWLLRTIVWPIRHFGRVLADSGKATVAIARIQEILDQPTEQASAEDGLLDSSLDAPRDDRSTPGIDQVAGDIEVRDLSFSYRTGTPALHNISLRIDEGSTVALIGPPGSGKSTLVSLLVRLYEYEEGSVSIGGNEVRSTPRTALRRAFGIVQQDPFLYSATINENLRVGYHDAPEERIYEAAKDAAVHDNILRLGSGYETKIGERGVTLSGGQRQRLAIARAFLREPTFLVLDDSLSAVDTKTEARILETLAERTGRQTTILISHRLSSTRLADKIFVLRDGRVEQEGSHDQLVSQPGYYQRLWEIQGKLEDQIHGDLEAAVPSPKVTTRNSTNTSQETRK